MQKQQAEKVIVVVPQTAAGSTNINGTGVDMAGWESIEFIAITTALTATQVTKIKAQASSDNGSTDDWSDLEGTATAAIPDNANNKAGRLEIVKPRKRYIRPVILRGTENASIGGMIAILRGAHNEPITQDASVSVSKSVVSPAEGTP